MKVLVQPVNFNIDKDLLLFIETKLEKLEKFHDKVVSIEVFLKVEKTKEKENKIVEVKVNVPGNNLIFKRVTKTFEEGVLLASDSLKRQLTKYKERDRV